MNRIVLLLLSLIAASCTSSLSSEQDSVALSANCSSLSFEAEGGEATITVTTSRLLNLIPKDDWITISKGVKSKDHKTVVTVVASKNPSTEQRETQIDVIAGDETIDIQVIQAGNENGTTNEDPNPDFASGMLVALSFDDGPNNQTTPDVLDILEEHNVPASFFVIGQNINDSTAEQMKRAISLGCEIQNHSYTHSYMTKMTQDKFIDELKRTDDLVEKYTSTRPTLFRPPYIDHNKSMHDAVDHIFINGVGCQDWEAGISAEDRFNDLMSKVKDGDIILLHDFSGNVNTVEALKMIIPELKSRGYNLVTVSELFEIKGISPQSHSGLIYTNVLQ